MPKKDKICKEKSSNSHGEIGTLRFYI